MRMRATPGLFCSGRVRARSRGLSQRGHFIFLKKEYFKCASASKKPRFSGAFLRMNVLNLLAVANVVGDLLVTNGFAQNIFDGLGIMDFSEKKLRR